MSRKIGVVVWALGLALSTLLLFVLEHGMTATFWITFAFVWAAFLSLLIFQWSIVKNTATSDDGFLHIPALWISLLYEVVQIPVCIIFALRSATISSKLALLCQGTLFIIAWAAILLSLGGNEHIRRVNSRQKDYHVEL